MNEMVGVVGWDLGGQGVIMAAGRQLTWSGMATVAALLLIFATPSVSRATVVLGGQDWDTYPADGVGNWTALGSSASIGENASDGGDHWLQIDFPSIAGDPGAAWYETISLPAEDLFAGSWAPNMFLQMDFWSADTTPAGLQFRWGSTNGNTWGYSVVPDSEATNSWRTYQASLAEWEDWRINPFLSEDDYLADLQSVDWVGVYVYRAGTDPETYGLDDFNLMVPEPSQFLFLGGAVAAVVASVRRKRSGQAKA